MKDLLTASLLATFRRCRRQHFYRNELRLVRDRDEAPRRIGSAFHLGLELKNKGLLPEDECIEQAVAGYATCPEWMDPTEWAVEAETVRVLLAGHFWRYGGDELAVVACETTWQCPLRHPTTGRRHRTFDLAGKDDLIARLPDTRLAVVEYKTAGEDIGPDAAYWLRLRGDPQISQYVVGARANGHDVATVWYDVTRKPTIRPKKLTQAESDEFLRTGAYFAAAFTVEAGTDTNTADPADGGPWVKVDGERVEIEVGAKGRVSVRETPEMYGARLLDDIGQRPDYYYQRREVPRLDADLDEFRLEVWQQAESLKNTRRRGLWYRNVGRLTCDYCDYSGLCLQSVKVDPVSPPTGFKVLATAHPELETSE